MQPPCWTHHLDATWANVIATEGVDAIVAAELAAACTGGALDAVDALLRQERAEVRLYLDYLLRAIPLYWEHPQISPEFQALLERQ